MPATISVTEDGLFVALWTFIVDLLGVDGQQVLRTQQNRAPMTKGDFVYMTPIRLDGLSYTRTEYAPGLDQRIDIRESKWHVQLDFYGDQAYEWAATFATILRTSKATEMLDGTPISPLYVDDPWQGAIINSETQWEQRWTLDAHFQAEMAVTTDQQFADELIIETVAAESLNEGA